MQVQEFTRSIKEMLQYPPEQFCYYFFRLKKTYDALKEMHAGKYYQLLINFPQEWKNADVRIPEVREAYCSTNKPVMWAIVERNSEELPVAYTSLDYAKQRYNRRVSGKRKIIDENFPRWHMVEAYQALPTIITLQNLYRFAQNENPSIEDWKAFEEKHISCCLDTIKAIIWMNNTAVKEPLTQLRMLVEGRYGRRLGNRRELNDILGGENYDYKIRDLEKPIVQITILNPYSINKNTLKAFSHLLF